MSKRIERTIAGEHIGSWRGLGTRVVWFGQLICDLAVRQCHLQLRWLGEPGAGANALEPRGSVGKGFVCA
jgi:hypothetical protein